MKFHRGDPNSYLCYTPYNIQFKIANNLKITNNQLCISNFTDTYP